MAAEGDGLVVSVAAEPSDVLSVAAVRAFLTAAACDARLARARSGSHLAIATEGVDARRRADPPRAFQAHATRRCALAVGAGTGAVVRRMGRAPGETGCRRDRSPCCLNPAAPIERSGRCSTAARRRALMRHALQGVAARVARAGSARADCPAITPCPGDIRGVAGALIAASLRVRRRGTHAQGTGRVARVAASTAAERRRHGGGTASLSRSSAAMGARARVRRRRSGVAKYSRQRAVARRSSGGRRCRGGSHGGDVIRTGATRRRS